MVYTVLRRRIQSSGASERKERQTMPDRLDQEILAKFRELTPENQEAILAYLVEVLFGPAASSSDRR
nr:MAG TPA: hypothetical protein [Caudoviricetes sp.]